MNKLCSMLAKRFLVIAFLAGLLIVIATGNERKTIVTYNSNNVKSVEAMHIVSKYNINKDKLKTISVSNMREVALYGPSTPVSFVGEMTGYGADCKGCGNSVSCPPRPIVTNGNIYFDDQTYGKIRILAADSTIPCGSIVRISNVNFSVEPIIGVVLDRGSAIKGNIIDFLVESEGYSKANIGRQKNVNFEIIRWGW